MYPFTPSTEEAEADEPLSSRPAGATQCDVVSQHKYHKL